MIMFDLFKNIDILINELLLSIGFYGPILGCFLILIESVVPVLPLFVFITINFFTFGPFLGFIISWIFTVLGCLMSFFIFRKKIKKWFDKKVGKKEKLNKIMKVINEIKLEELTAIIAIPFTPAFLINIAAGLSKMNFKKFLIALMIGKIFLVLFWGFVGTSLLESLTNPQAFIKVVMLVLVAFIISKIVNKKYKLD